MENFFNILNEVSNDVNVELTNTMYNGIYKYTLTRYREAFKTHIIKLQNENKISKDITVEIINNFLVNKIITEYKPLIEKQINEINLIPIVEQKSPEWFKLREDMISASDSGYFLKKCGVSKALDSLKIKIGLKSYANSTAPPLMHGNTYEDITRAIYESRNKVVVFEHGILKSKTNFIGASPDGIVVDCLDNKLECQARYGRLLEIKNPYSREIDNDVKPEYMVQILQQQYTTGLPVCDFVETTIVDKYCKPALSNYKPYETLEDMLNDKLNTNNPSWQNRIKNHNIPFENLNKYGNEKGLVVWYQKIINPKDIRNKYILYPLQNKYQTENIEKWIVDTNATQFNNGFTFKETKYWRLDVYSEKTVVYDQQLFEHNYIAKLSDVWNIIIKCREFIQCGKNVEKYIEDLENKKDNPFYNENKRSKTTTRNISKTNNNNSATNTTTTTNTTILNNNNTFELDF